ncbi:MAG: DsbA family protein [Candidatus Altimarinota bacterium]
MNQENKGFFSTLKKDFQTSFSINFLFIIIILATLSIILTNYIFSRNVIKEVHLIIQNYEYSKVGGEENYKILREIQKEQTNSYITDMIENNPEYIEEIKAKIDPNYKKIKKLSQEEITILKEGSAILGNQEQPYTVIEFSNFSCKYCQTFHAETSLQDFLKSYETMNYVFKNMVNKEGTQDYDLALYGKCISQEKQEADYLSYINEAFNIGEENKDTFLEKIISKYSLGETFQKCISSDETKLALEKEFGQGVYLGVVSTPSFVILDNLTGKYSLIEGLLSKEEMKAKLDSFMIH